MNGDSLGQKLWRRVSNYGFILAMGIAAVIAFKTPIQHFIPINRYQHTGITIFLFGMGYVMQTIWSWRSYMKWARIANCATSVFFCSVGIFFYTNTWLDNSMAEPTREQALLRCLFIGIYLTFALIVSMLWIKWAQEDNKLKEAEKQASANEVAKPKHVEETNN